MIYTTEHLLLVFILGIVVGVCSTLMLSRNQLDAERIVSLLIVSVWLSISTYGFFFDLEVPWLLDFAGFGAAGNFIGIKISDVTDRFANKVMNKK